MWDLCICMCISGERSVKVSAGRLDLRCHIGVCEKCEFAWMLLDSDGPQVVCSASASPDLKCEGRNMSVQRAKLEGGKWGRVPHGLVIRTSPRCCGCSGDRFLQCRGHIITLTHFCAVSTSTKVSSLMGGQHNHAGKWAHRVLAKF